MLLMQYAMHNGRRSEALPGLRGTCPMCEADVVSKCGPRVTHHWAHARRQSCEPWWENETAWHREWKAMFPEECREVCHTAPDGEVHRADVVTQSGIVVEIQNSPMSDQERLSREAFYGNMVWIVNGAAFRHQFHILHRLPDPTSDLAADLVWYKAKANLPGSAAGIFWRRSENPSPERGVLIHGLQRFEDEVLATFCGHHQFDWVRPRAGWLESTCPVFIDLGDDWVWQLVSYGPQELPCVRAVAKRKLVHDAMVERLATDIATRFYPIARAASGEDGA